MSTIATGSQADLGYMLEGAATYGQAPTGTRYKSVRRKSAAGLNLTKDTYDSEEVRSDRMLADSRHGVRRATGDVETEISPGSYDDFFLALLGSADIHGANGGWTLGAATETTDSVTFAAAPANTITRATSFITAGFRIGDRITIANSVSPNNGDATIIGISSNGLVLTVDRALGNDTGTATITVKGKKALVGAVYNSFTLERAYMDLATPKYQYFTGMRVNSAAVSLPPTGLATITWNFLGKDASALGDTPISGQALVNGKPYTASNTNAVLAAVNGVIAISDTNGSRTLATVTELNFTVDNQLGGSEVVGQNVIPEALWGNTQMVTGKVTVLFEDEKMYNLFHDEGEASLMFRMDSPPSLPGGFLSFTFPRCKFNSGAIGDAVATGLPVEMEFRALLPHAASTAHDASQIVIQTNV